MMMGQIEARAMQWFAVRVKARAGGGLRTTRVGGDFEAYRDNTGQVRKRRVAGTGDRVFLPEHLLRRAGFEVFLPVKKVWQRKNRFGSEKVLVSHPLLMDWIFVGWPSGQARWHELMALDVVCGVMGTGGMPVMISDARILRLMRQWGGDHLSAENIQAIKKAYTFFPGDALQVLDGTFQGFDVRVIDASGPSVRALLNIFGRDTEVLFAPSTLGYASG